MTLQLPQPFKQLPQSLIITSAIFYSKYSTLFCCYQYLIEITYWNKNSDHMDIKVQYESSSIKLLSFTKKIAEVVDIIQDLWRKGCGSYKNMKEKIAEVVNTYELKQLLSLQDLLHYSFLARSPY